MIIPESVGILKFSHDITILPQMVRWFLCCSVLWAGLIQQNIQALRVGTGPAPAASAPALPASVLHVGIGHKIHAAVRFTLATADIPCVILLTFGVAVLLSLPCLFIIRHGILGTIRVSILYQSSHESPHIGAVALHPSQFQLQGPKPTIAFQSYHSRVSIDAI